MAHTKTSMVIFLIALLFSGVAIAADNTYYLPYYISDSDHWTAVGLRNNSGTDTADVDITIYNTTGNIIGTENTLIPPRGQNNFVVGQGLSAAGWLKVESDQEISGLCFFAATSGLDYMADIPLVTELSALLYVPHVGQGPVFDTNLLICNPNNSEINITARFVNQSGDIIYTTPIVIPANGSTEYRLSDMVDSSNEANSGSVELCADNPIAAFAVYTNRKKDQYCFAGIDAIIPGPGSPGGECSQQSDAFDITGIYDQNILYRVSSASGTCGLNNGDQSGDAVHVVRNSSDNVTVSFGIPGHFWTEVSVTYSEQIDGEGTEYVFSTNGTLMEGGDWTGAAYTIQGEFEPGSVWAYVSITGGSCSAEVDIFAHK